MSARSLKVSANQVRAARRIWRLHLDPLRSRPDFPDGFEVDPMAIPAIQWLLDLERSTRDGDVHRAARALKTWASLKTIYERTRAPGPPPGGRPH